MAILAKNGVWLSDFLTEVDFSQMEVERFKNYFQKSPRISLVVIVFTIGDTVL